MEIDLKSGNLTLEEFYDNKGTDDVPTFSELIEIFAGHVNNEEELVVPLLDYLNMKANGLKPDLGNLKQVAREFSTRYKEMEQEHAEARRAAHRLAGLSKVTRNRRAYKIWTSIENHVKLEERALLLAESSARSILLEN